MNFWRNTKYFLTNLTRKHRLSLRREHSRRELWYMHISPLNVIVGLVTLVVMLLIVIMVTVAYSPILDLIPGYPGSRSREMLISNILKIDSLEQQMNSLELYNANMAMIMSGKSPVTREILKEDSTRTRIEFIDPSDEDSLLRRQMEAEGIYSLASASSTLATLRPVIDAYPPISGGAVLSPFSPSDMHFGVTLAAAPDSEIVAAMQGTVVSSLWTPENGTTIYIQHLDNMISIYKRNLSSRVSAGQRVRAGEIIGYIINTGQSLEGEGGLGSGTLSGGTLGGGNLGSGVSSGNTGNTLGSNALDQSNLGESAVDSLLTTRLMDDETSYFEFELWHNGAPVDPENYIVF